MEKDYYKILGVSDEEKALKGEDFKKAVKSKFRSLSRQYHPDRCKDDSKKKEYEEKFKEIAEAYSVLSDEDKRSQYDNPSMGGANFGGFGNFNMDDILNSVFGNGFGGFSGFGNYGGKKQTSQRVKGSNLRVVFRISLEDAYNGGEKKIKYKRDEVCSSCSGSGKTSRSVEEMCPHCGGTGQLLQNFGNGMQVMTGCHHCGGKGSILKNPCTKCGGSGVEQKEHQVAFQIPKGVVDGYSFILSGEANAPTHGKGEYGDLEVILSVNPHDKFVRKGNDLYFELKVPVIDALLGCQTEVETIDGKKLKTNIPSCSANGTKIRFAGKGMPYFNSSKYGDMYGVVTLVMPKSLTSEEKRILSQLKAND